MKISRKSAAVAAVAASALALSACAGGSGDGESDGAGINDSESVNIAWNQPFYSYNGNSMTGNATANNVVLYMMRSGFNYYDEDLNLVLIQHQKYSLYPTDHSISTRRRESYPYPGRLPKEIFYQE